MKSKILMSLIFGILLISFVSALEIDNVKSYDPINKEATFSNSFLGIPTSEIAKVKLDTPLEVLVMPGKDRKVAEFTIDLIADEYNEPIKNIEMYYNDGNKFSREFRYKYKTYENYIYLEPVYSEVCKSITIDNKTFTKKEVCSNEIVSYDEVTKQKEVWNDFDLSRLTKGEITIGVFTDVELEDYKVEWIPTMFGNIKVTEWATWTSSLSVGLQAYFTMDETGSSFNDATPLARFNSTGGASLTYGKINNSRSFEGAPGADISGGSAILQQGNFTWNGWFYGTGNQDFISSADKAYLGVFTGVISFYAAGGTCNAWCKSSYTAASGWYMVTLKYDTSGSMAICFNGTCGYTFSENTGWDKTNSVHLGYSSITAYGLGGADEVGFWNRTLNNTEISDLYNSGAGLTHPSVAGPYTTSVTLLSPTNGASLSSATINFSSNSTFTGWRNISNVTYYISNQTGYYNTTVLLNPSTNETSLQISGFPIGNYHWNVKYCFVNNTNYNCTSASSNFSFSVGAVLNSSSYNLNVYETANENFYAIFDILPGSEISGAKLVYNGTNYTISNLSVVGDKLYLQNKIDIPLNTGGANNQRNFFYSFTYSGNNTQLSSPSQQNVSQIVFTICNATIGTVYLNITYYDESTLLPIDAATNNTNIKSNWNYWLGTGTVTKNYSYQNIASTSNNYQFCFIPQNQSMLNYDVNIEYGASNYFDNGYNLAMGGLTNVSTNLTLYLLSTSLGTKFTHTVREGIDLVPNVMVNIEKFFTGLGIYKQVGLKSTDTTGRFTQYLEIDKKYRYTVIKNNISSTSILLDAICTVTPCEITLQVEGNTTQIMDEIEAYIAQNVNYTLFFNRTEKVVYLDYEDKLGTAHYWRLFVYKPYFGNQSEDVICNITSFTIAGNMSCNTTGYMGDIFAKVYISRSPEKLVDFLDFMNDDIAPTLGDSGILASIIILLVIIFAGSRNPTNAVIMIPFGIIILKFISFLPLSWGTISAITVICWIIASKMKT